MRYLLQRGRAPSSRQGSIQSIAVRVTTRLYLRLLEAELGFAGRHWPENLRRPLQFLPVAGSWRGSPGAARGAGKQQGAARRNPLK
jgi:hypothetical protein